MWCLHMETLRITILYVSRLFHIFMGMCMALNCLAYNINGGDAKMDRFMKVVNRLLWVIFLGMGIYLLAGREQPFLDRECAGTAGERRQALERAPGKGRHAVCIRGSLWDMRRRIRSLWRTGT